jgi:hypothetical protein
MTGPPARTDGDGLTPNETEGLEAADAGADPGADAVKEGATDVVGNETVPGELGAPESDPGEPDAETDDPGAAEGAGT